MSEKNKIVIVAPHFDDEIIGCFEVVVNEENPPVIVYTEFDESETVRKDEALKLKEHTKVSMQFFNRSIPPIFLNPNTTLYLPDPVFEIHPSHRKWGSIGEQLVRQNLNVVFYSVNMQAPYIHESRTPKVKESLLDKVYPSQKDLWKYEKKFVLFEGYIQWMMKPKI